MKSQKPKAAVFDVDGTVLNTQNFMYRTYEDTLAALGQPLPSRVAIAQQIGPSLTAAYLALAPNADTDALCAAHREIQQRPGMADLITVYPFVPELLGLLKDNGVARAAWSSRSTAVASLEHTNIAHLFDAIVHGGQVTHHKPHPEGFLRVLEMLQIEPKNAAMIEDAGVGILAAKAAGAGLTIGITHGFGTRAELEAADPDYIVDSMTELPPLLLPNIRASARA